MLGKIIYYLRENRIYSAPILSMEEVKNLHEDWAHTEAEKQIFTPFGPQGIYYYTCHGLVLEKDAYATKEELINSLGDEPLEGAPINEPPKLCGSAWKDD